MFFSFSPWLKHLSNWVCNFCRPHSKRAIKTKFMWRPHAGACHTAALDYLWMWDINSRVRLEVNWVITCYWRKLVLASLKINTKSQGVHKLVPAGVPIPQILSTNLIWLDFNLVWEPMLVLCIYFSINEGLIANTSCLPSRHIMALPLARPQAQTSVLYWENLQTKLSTKINFRL